MMAASRGAWLMCGMVGLVLLEAAGAARAGDWPMLLGPTRNGVVPEGELLEALPAGGLQPMWERPVGSGVSGWTVRGGKAVLFHRLRDDELVECFELATGKTIWKRSFPTQFRPAIFRDDGPRSTPALSADAAVVVSPEGEIRCLALEDGSLKWTVPAAKEYTSPHSYFGAGFSPVVDGERVLVGLGDTARDSGLAAFDLATGHKLWGATREIESYSTPVVATVDGTAHALFVTRLHVVSVDPATGAERFRFPFGQRGPTVNAASPLVVDGRLFVSASYGVGARWAAIGTRTAEVLWEDDEIMSSQYTTCVPDGGYLYGIHGRDDVPPASLRCVDPRTRKVHWEVENVGPGHLIRAGGRIALQTVGGELIVFAADPQRYRELYRAKLFRGDCRSVPAFAEGVYLARDPSTARAWRLGTPERVR